MSDHPVVDAAHDFVGQTLDINLSVFGSDNIPWTDGVNFPAGGGLAVCVFCWPRLGWISD
jgi:hypothetical protein